VQIIAPLGTYFVDTQQELAEAACLFDLSEHRLHHFPSQSARRFEAAVVDLFLRISRVSGPPNARLVWATAHRLSRCPTSPPSSSCDVPLRFGRSATAAGAISESRLRTSVVVPVL
jgi:hypothetical protein